VPVEIPVEAAPVDTAVPAPVPAPTPVPKKATERRRGNSHIFSESTQNVWSVFRSGNARAVLLILLIMGVIVAIIVLWELGGGSLNNLPFVKQLVNQ
jgi:hypothetical protein